MSVTIPNKEQVEAHRALDDQLRIVRQLLANADLRPSERDKALLVNGGGGDDPTGRLLALRAHSTAAEAVKQTWRLKCLWVREAEFQRVLADVCARYNVKADPFRQRAEELERKLQRLRDAEDDVTMGYLAIWHLAVGKPPVS